MRITYQVGADSRHDQGKGASRRLRRAGKVPAVLYGGHGQPQNLTLDHQQLLTLIDKEKFYASIISINVEKHAQPAIVRDVQMHDGSHLRIRKLERDFDPTDRLKALQALEESEAKGEVLTGVLYLNTNKPTFLDLLNLVDEPVSTLPESKVRPAKSVLDSVMDELR